MSSRSLTQSNTPQRPETAMDLRKLKTLIDLVQQSGIGELEITEGEEKVRISRGVPAGIAQNLAPPGTVYVTGPIGAADTVSAGVSAEPPATAEPEGHVVKAPM